MSDLIQTVSKGVIQQTKSNANEAAKNQLGKDAFLKLLTTQMKYQDPLNPNTDTEFIAQLATFSQLEQMQNLGSLTTNSQALSLVGRTVIVKSESQTGNSTYISGKVDFVNLTGGKAQLSIGGKLYSVNQLDSVIDDLYILEQGFPGLENAMTLNYDGANPKDITFNVNLGSGDTVADNVAIIVGNKLLEAKFVKVEGNKVTIDKAAFGGYDNGSHKVTVVFNDALLTTVKDMVKLQVKNAVITEPDDDNTEIDPDNDSTDNDNTVNETGSGSSTTDTGDTA